MDAAINVIVENTTPASPLIGEYGFSAQLLIDNHNILFDTGSNHALFKNSTTLGIDLSLVEEIVVSHGHYDHTGAVMPFLKKYGGRKIYAHSGIFAHRLISRTGGQMIDIGCSFAYQEAVDAGADFIFTDTFTEIHPGIYLTGQIPRLTGYEDVGGNFLYEKDGQFHKDLLPDDMAMLIDHPEGLIIISGCSHSGMVNTLEYCRQKTGRSKVLAYIGGTHLINASRERLDKTIDAVNTYQVQKLIVGHCTGFYAAAELYNRLGRQRVIKMDAGLKYIF
ncbi:metal-dependent hydrolase of the beta-lactamase superfamily ii [hydrocarbon metagenome]|uniref:Metal-dependent hydrolase of the beta-lactamase superfamily ii n=1 Tax=hydrocarbon metagenome TaxID=938273 RepID=A0A0W8E2L6_9ZZZZ